MSETPPRTRAKFAFFLAGAFVLNAALWLYIDFGPTVRWTVIGLLLAAAVFNVWAGFRHLQRARDQDRDR